jgi:hypothetical protein
MKEYIVCMIHEKCLHVFCATVNSLNGIIFVAAFFFIGTALNKTTAVITNGIICAMMYTSQITGLFWVYLY